MLLTIVSFIVLLLILIFVHELGHFLVAKLLGVGVDSFSLGFPPRIWSKKIGETVYQVCWLPLGGYVKLCGEEPGDDVPPEKLAKSFNHKPVWVRIAVVFAGPLFNLVFAFLAMWALVMAIGVSHAPSTVGMIPEDGPAYRAGLRYGDLVTGIDGREVSFYDQIEEIQELSDGSPVAVSVERDGAARTFQVTPRREDARDMLGDSSPYWSLGLRPLLRTEVGRVVPGKPADLAGLRPGDLITAIDGRAIRDWVELEEIVQGPAEGRGKPGPVDIKPLNFEVLRDGRTMSFMITPVAEPSQNLDGETVYTPLISISSRPTAVRERVGPFRAAHFSLRDCWNITTLTFSVLGKIVSHKISPKVMGGPILIAEQAGLSIRSGLDDFIFLMVLISINLAIINLVPLPVFDGGQILIFLVEGVRRKPLSLRVREVSQMVGVGALVALMVLVFYNDISRIVTRRGGPPPAVQTGQAE
ncbi:MAG: RIP metalloprotease RseP [Deltaproteobacteria bacterium]|jgi:regulator of sigma E protease|nr:RIP metalloprotease RseP [Deltaproteobacteria bacterium]